MPYIVNPGGVTQSVTEEALAVLVTEDGFRAATPEEAAAWESAYLPQPEADKAAKSSTAKAGAVAGGSGGVLPPATEAAPAEAGA